MNVRFSLLLLSLALLAPACAGAREIPAIDFFKHAEFTQVKLSPTGEYLAVTVPQDDRTLLAVLRTKDKKLVAKWDYGAQMHPYNVTWIKDSRFMVRVMRKTGSLDRPVGEPEIFMADADGSHRLALPMGGTYELVDKLVDEPTKVLMQRTIERPNLFKVDVNTGYMSKVAVSPTASGDFVVDHAGKVRYAVGEDEKGLKFQVFRNDGEGKWTPVSDKPAYQSQGDSEVPLGFAADNKHIYMSISHDGKPAELHLVDPETGSDQVLFGDPKVDLGDTIWSYDDSHMLGVSYMPDMQSNVYFDNDDAETKWRMQLDNAFPDENVDITSQTKDGRLALVHVHSDVDPGKFYLFDTQAKKATFLLANRSWIEPTEMSPVKPIEFKARDGLDLHGYLTIPKGSGGKGLPMVVWVHGGPMARDEWDFDPVVQFLANRGYAVLQVNYRGSSGYGEAFQDAGYRHWGTTMQDDLTDAVRWTIGQGVADAKRVCIFGGSYGGYAALMSPEREPDLYQCAIGYAGVYSLPMQMSKSDTAHYDAGQTYLHKAYPETVAEQQAQSPAYNVEKLKAAVMLVHGGQDKRVPIAHMHFLIDQMAKVGKKPEVVLVQDKEEHGFYDPAHNVDLYTKVAAFLDEHIGGKSKAATAKSN